MVVTVALAATVVVASMVKNQALVVSVVPEVRVASGTEMVELVEEAVQVDLEHPQFCRVLILCH